MHSPKRGSALLCSRPRVHAGFLRSWTANGFNERVLEHIGEIVDTQQMDLSSVRVLLTGAKWSLSNSVTCNSLLQSGVLLKRGLIRLHCRSLAGRGHR